MNEGQPVDFGSKLRELRLGAGLSQEALAERARLSVQAIGALERGDRKVPYRDTIVRISEALELTPEQRKDLEAAAAQRRGMPRRTAATGSAVSGTIPAPVTSLVGRADDVANVVTLLRRDGVRLVTLTGAGGIGKTRLALQAASSIARHFRDGVCAIGLASVGDPSNVDSEIAFALGLTLTGAKAVRDAVCRYLETRNMVLVLDNFEHIRGAAPTITNLLERCPGIKVLVTSREALRVPGEHEYIVAPLQPPKAVELFDERAKAVNPRFSLAATNETAVLELCRRVDNLPLGVELAAPLTRLGSPTQLLQLMELRLDVSVASEAAVLERHKTMRNAIAWSYDLLDANERKLFRRLAVFVGGFDVDAARSICDTGAAADHQFLPTLTALLDKSLLHRWELHSGEIRLGMLETIRQFALERLADSGEGPDVGRRHAAYFVEWSIQAGAGARTGEEAIWHERLDAEIGNLRTAMVWARDQDALESGLTIAIRLLYYWEKSGLITEGRRWLDLFLEQTDVAKQEPSVAVVDALLASGLLADRQCDYEAGQQRLERALSDAERLSYRPGVLRSKQWLGSAAHARGDYSRAISLLKESLGVAREMGDPFRTAQSLSMLAAAVLDSGDVEASVVLFEKALALHRSSGTVPFIAQILANLGRAERMRGNDGSAASLLNESLTLSRQVGNQWTTAVALAWLGDVESTTGDFEKAETHYRESLLLNQSIGSHETTAIVLEGLGRVALARGEVVQAVRLWSRACDERTAIGSAMAAKDRASLTEALQAARARLGDQKFETAWLEGSLRPLADLMDA